MGEALIVSGGRTPFGRFGGTLRDMPVIQMAAHIVKSVIERAGIKKEHVDEVIMGVCTQADAEEVIAPIIARQVLLKVGLPPTTISLTLDRACCSGMTAAILGSFSIQRGDSSVVVAGGVENMSRTPMIIRPLRWGSVFGDVVIRDPAYGLRYVEYNPVTIDAGEEALEFGVSREEQDEWAVRSQQRYAEALSRGFFEEEIIPISVPARKGEPVIFSRDEFPRPDTTLDKLKKLPTVFGSPTITAGNAPGINDGAAAMVLMSKGRAQELGIAPLAQIVSTASVAIEPRRIASVPAVAIRKLLQKTGLKLDDIALIEINEAFAAMPLVSSLVLAEGDRSRAEAIREKINVNGGAIAVGHPVGASGARILITLMYELRRRGGGYGIATICGGLAQGDAVLIRVD